MSRPPKLSKAMKREAQRKAAEEFFSRRNRPETQIRLLNQPQQAEQAEQVQPAAATGLPKPGAVLDINQSKEILARLASGEIKQVRR